ncbi:thioredoxin domain-containing protein [Blastopirellula retiformator]|uniref:RedB protein n=1 Tax=Blastopirellula retiformator TaxID=2527970 RepID=A0A5C5UUL9_9BACT|nr:hypothetical protein [Blastopirellula retiformator]TWT30026.1 hypothetical protein Enr8_46830 [Blastopirellula retiformator]
MNVPATSSRWKCPLTTLLTGWIVAICLVWWNMTAYSFQIDAEPTPIEVWPAVADIPLAADRPTVLLFLHPRCPCSVASLAELEQAIAATPSDLRPNVQVVATVPQEYDASWTDTKTMARSENLPGASVFVDVGGHESQKFGAASSGHVMAFAPSGELLYSGGVTHSRGHEGDNVGRASLVRVLSDASDQSHVAAELPAFGCRLFLPDSTCAIVHPGQTPPAPANQESTR